MFVVQHHRRYLSLMSTSPISKSASDLTSNFLSVGLHPVPYEGSSADYPMLIQYTPGTDPSKPTVVMVPGEAIDPFRDEKEKYPDAISIVHELGCSSVVLRESGRKDFNNDPISDTPHQATLDTLNADIFQAVARTDSDNIILVACSASVNGLRDVLADFETAQKIQKVICISPFPNMVQLRVQEPIDNVDRYFEENPQFLEFAKQLQRLPE